MHILSILFFLKAYGDWLRLSNVIILVWIVMQASYNSDAFVHLHFGAILFSNRSQDQKALPDKYQDFW